MSFIRCANIVRLSSPCVSGTNLVDELNHLLREWIDCRNRCPSRLLEHLFHFRRVRVPDNRSSKLYTYSSFTDLEALIKTRSLYFDDPKEMDDLVALREKAARLYHRECTRHAMAVNHAELLAYAPSFRDVSLIAFEPGTCNVKDTSEMFGLLQLFHDTLKLKQRIEYSTYWNKSEHRLVPPHQWHVSPFGSPHAHSGAIYFDFNLAAYDKLWTGNFWRKNVSTEEPSMWL